jgi:hypothetical protein
LTFSVAGRVRGAVWKRDHHVTFIKCDHLLAHPFGRLVVKKSSQRDMEQLWFWLVPALVVTPAAIGHRLPLPTTCPFVIPSFITDSTA